VEPHKGGKEAGDGGDDDDYLGAEIQGNRITRVSGEEDDTGEWSDNDGNVEIEPFNLKKEQEEGYFDVNGHYVENRFKTGVKDAWLDEYDEKWAKQFRAKEAKAASEAKLDDDLPLPPLDKSQLKSSIIELLNPRETVTSALKRYSGRGQDKRQKDIAKFDRLTENADFLLAAGYTDVYSAKREKLEAELRQENRTDNVNAASFSTSSGEAVLWEYKVKDGTTFGPYTSQDMAAWVSQGYFSGDQAVMVRRLMKQDADNIFDEAESESEFVSSDHIDFTSYM